MLNYLLVAFSSFRDVFNSYNFSLFINNIYLKHLLFLCFSKFDYNPHCDCFYLLWFGFSKIIEY
jgi:hypothetical protein